MSILIDYVVELGLNAIKDKVTDIKTQREIRERLQAFIKRQSKINELSTMAEEIDFQGLAEYITGNLMDDVRVRLFGKKKERQSARETIINKAVAYSQARTELAKRRVVKLISDILNILREFYLSRVSQSVSLIAAEIVDDVEDIVKEQATEQNKRIIDELSASIKEVGNSSIMSVDNNIKLTKLGKLDEVEANLSSVFRCIGSQHELYPYYRYAPEVVNGKVRFLSKPLSFDAVEKYPPKMRCKGTIKLGGQQLEQFDLNTIDYANRHQMPITISIQEAKKFLGDIDDPIQQEAEDLVGKNVVISPKPFPAPFPCSVILDGNIEFDYILLRAQEMMEDGTMVISNQEQEKCPFRISIKLNIANNKTDFSFSIENSSNIDMLRYVRFMKKASGGAQLVIKVLSAGQNLMEGTLQPFDYKSYFETVDEEIAFLEKVVSIENYFGKPIALPNEIYTDDYETISYLAGLINGDEIHGNWSKAEFTFELNENNKDKIIEMGESQYSISYVAGVCISLYQEQYHLSITRTFDRVRVNDLEKLKKKADVLDVGDSIRIKYLPGEENGIGSYVDILHTEPLIAIEKEE